MPIIDEYLAHCARRGLRPSYIDDQRRTLLRLDRTFGPLEHATEDLIEDWWATIDVAPATRVVYAAHLTGFFGWLVHTRRRNDNPAGRLIRPRVHRRLPRPMADRTLSEALAAAAYPINAWLALAAYMGFRACEIATLEGEDVHPHRVFIRDGKGGKQRVVPLHPVVSELLHGIPSKGPAFTNSYGGKLQPNTVSQAVNRHLRSLGCVESIHQARHWFGTNAYRISKDLRLVQELMGHENPNTTAGYAAWDQDQAAHVVAALTVPSGAEPVDGSHE